MGSVEADGEYEVRDGFDGGAEAEKVSVRLVVTGFGPFRNVPDNPTQRLVERLQREELQRKNLKGSRGGEKYDSAVSATEKEQECGDTRLLLNMGAELAHCEVMKTCAQTVTQRLQALHEEFDCSPYIIARPQEQEQQQQQRPFQVIYIHLGVNRCARQFYLETRAFNEADFGCPDESGWQPRKEPISGTGSIDSTRNSSLPLSKVAESLRSRGFAVGLSMDAGRFVCNWTYFKSLMLAERCNNAQNSGALTLSGMNQVRVHAVFVHVPSTEQISFNTQWHFLRALLEELGTEATSNHFNLAFRPASAPAFVANS